MSSSPFNWSPSTISNAYVSNDQVNWVQLGIELGRNYIVRPSKFSQFKYMMLPPNSVAYLYNNAAADSNNYNAKFVGAYYSAANNGNYNTQPFSLTGLQVIDFHSDNDYLGYCSCQDNISTCENQNFEIGDNIINCNDTIPAILPAPTYFEPPSTMWIWITVAAMAFCCLVVFVLIILFLVGVFKFGQHSIDKSAELAEVDEKSLNQSTKATPATKATTSTKATMSSESTRMIEPSDPSADII